MLYKCVENNIPYIVVTKCDKTNKKDEKNMKEGLLSYVFKKFKHEKCKRCGKLMMIVTVIKKMTLKGHTLIYLK